MSFNRILIGHCSGWLALCPWLCNNRRLNSRKNKQTFLLNNLLLFQLNVISRFRTIVVFIHLNLLLIIILWCKCLIVRYTFGFATCTFCICICYFDKILEITKKIIHHNANGVFHTTTRQIDLSKYTLLRIYGTKTSSIVLSAFRRIVWYAISYISWTKLIALIWIPDKNCFQWIGMERNM